MTKKTMMRKRRRNPTKTGNKLLVLLAAALALGSAYSLQGAEKRKKPAAPPAVIPAGDPSSAASLPAGGPPSQPEASYQSHLSLRRGPFPIQQQVLNTEQVGGPSSHHTGGWHNVMGDGSVRFISENIDPKTLRNLTHRADGEMLSDF